MSNPQDPLRPNRVDSDAMFAALDRVVAETPIGIPHVVLEPPAPMEPTETADILFPEREAEPERVIAAAAPQYVSEDEVPEETREAEQRIYAEQAQDKPEQARPKIVEGRWRKWLEENVLLNQEHVNQDKHGGQTIEDLRAATASKTGENIVIRRFTRYQVGEEA